jgi:exosome complex RNA-binding protein Rrp42 (RNase PH superfamily)
MCTLTVDFFFISYGKTNRPSDEEVTITRMLDKVLKRSDAVDKESLCILAGQRVCFTPSTCGY